MSMYDELDPSLWEDPAVKRFAWPDPPPVEQVTMDLVNADPQTLLGYYERLSEMVDWQDLRTAAAGATRSNLEEAYDQAVDGFFGAMPKADGAEKIRLANARIQATNALTAFQVARYKHEIFKAILRSLERRLRVVEETLWTRKAALKARGGY